MSDNNNEIPPRVTFGDSTSIAPFEPAYYKEVQGEDGLFRLESCSKEEAQIVDDDHQLRCSNDFITVKPRLPTIIDALQIQGRCFRKGTIPSSDPINIPPSRDVEVPTSVWKVPEGVVERETCENPTNSGSQNDLDRSIEDTKEFMKQLIPDEELSKYACDLFGRSFTDRDSFAAYDLYKNPSLASMFGGPGNVVHYPRFITPDPSNVGMVNVRKTKEILDSVTDETAEELGFPEGQHPRDLIQDTFPHSFTTGEREGVESIGITKSMVIPPDFGYCSDMKQAQCRTFRSGNGKTFHTIENGATYPFGARGPSQMATIGNVEPSFKLNLICNAPPMTSARKDIPLQMEVRRQNIIDKLRILVDDLANGNYVDEDLLGTKDIDGTLHIPLLDRIQDDVHGCTFWTGDYDGDDGLISDSDSEEESDESSDDECGVPSDLIDAHNKARMRGPSKDVACSSDEDTPLDKPKMCDVPPVLRKYAEEHGIETALALEEESKKQAHQRLYGPSKKLLSFAELCERYKVNLPDSDDDEIPALIDSEESSM